MKNLADAIESMIMSELLRDQEETLLVQRNELAEKLSCAPSQISYVLSTRFTPERGFMVESRRGSGGFVRIVRMTPQQKPERKLTARELVHHFAAQRMITRREEKLLTYMFSIIDADEEKKKVILQHALEQMTGSGQR